MFVDETVNDELQRYIMTMQITEIGSAIRAANDTFEETFNRGDATGLSALYTENGKLMPTGSDFIEGKSNIAGFWQAAMDMGLKEARLQTVEVEDYGDTAVEVGQYSLSGEGGQMMDEGKYLVVWKQEQGQWKLHHDIWNSSLSA